MLLMTIEERKLAEDDKKLSKEKLGGAMDNKHIPRIIPIPALGRRRRKRLTNTPKIPNEQYLTDCQFIDYTKKRKKEETKKKK